MRTPAAICVIALLSCAVLAQSQSIPSWHVIDPASIDKSVDPCVDFYAYSCNGWIKSNPIPAVQAAWSVYSKLQEQNRANVRKILEAAAVPDTTRNVIDQKIGDYYASCMDERAIEAAGLEPLRANLKRIDDIATMEDLADFLARLHPQDLSIYFGQSALFSFDAEQDAKNSTETIAAVDQGGLGLPERDYYLKADTRSEQMRKDYAAHVQKMFQLLGNTPEAAAASAQVVVRIETALAKGEMTSVARRDPAAIYHRMTRVELADLAPSFPWESYFAGLGLSHVASLNVAAPEFFKAMEALLKSEDLSAWKTYLRWHQLHAQARWLPAAFVQEDFAFYGRKLTGARELPPRWKRCVRFEDRALGEAVGQAYVAHYFSGDAKQRALKMVLSIEAAMDRDLHQLPWMSDATKQQALAKLKAVVNKIGYPDTWRDYSTLTIVRGDALGNAERSNSFEFRRQLAKIGKPLVRGEWYLTPPSVNANYNAQMNDINFPAGVLQPPLFDPQADDAANFGQTGATIGHELTHGFDDEGRQFDGQGNLRDWWTASDAKEFKQRTACVAKQYSAYTVMDDVKVNGDLTLGENIADLGGLLLAYSAWKESVRDTKLKPIDELSPPQRFFVAYAQGWCSNQRPELQRMSAATDPHAPERYRTNGVVSNLPEFQKAFSCKPDAPMVHIPACRVW